MGRGGWENGDGDTVSQDFQLTDPGGVPPAAFPGPSPLLEISPHPLSPRRLFFLEKGDGVGCIDHFYSQKWILVFSFSK